MPHRVATLLIAAALLTGCDRSTKLKTDAGEQMTNTRIDTLVERANEQEARIQRLEAARP